MGSNSAVERAIAAKDGDSLAAAITEVEVPAGTLIGLLSAEWHQLHEDIVFELGLAGAATAVQPILEIAGRPPSYLAEWGNEHEFQRKCAYALARIATEDSREALRCLAASPDPFLKQYGQEALAKWPLPYRG